MTTRTVKTRLTGDVSDYQRAMLAGSASTKAFIKDLDSANDRTTMMTQSLLAVGPAVVPIAAVATPAVAGLTNQLAFAAAGAGVTALALSGVGDALEAVNDYAIDPTDENLQKMRQSLDELGPAGQEFVMFLQHIRPELQSLQDAAQAGLLPGAEDGIDALMSRLPQFESFIGKVGSTIGDLLAEGGENLADPRWDDFFTFLEDEARPTLIDMGRTAGNLAEGFTNLWMALDPLSDQFSDGFLQMSRDFATWSDQVDDTEGFQEFLDYVTSNGPQAWDTLGAIGNGLLQVVEAAAPVGEVALPVIEALADGLSTVADSPAGPVLIGAAAGISAISRAVALYNVTNGSALGSLLSNSAMGGGNFRKAAAATTELKVAQDSLARSAISARDAQFALIPTADKRKALAKYTALSKSTAEAEKVAAEATKARNAQMRNLATGIGLGALALSDYDDKLGLSNTAMLASAGTLIGPWGTAIGAGAGLAMDFASANDDVWAALDRVDTALAGGPANLEQQRLALDEVRLSLKAFQDDIEQGSKTNNLDPGKWLKSTKNAWEGLVGRSDEEELEDAIRSRTEAMAESEKAAADLAFAEDGLGSSMDEASDATRESTRAIIDNIKAHNDLADKLLAASDGEIAYEQALDDANERIGKRKELEKELAAEQDPEKAKKLREELETYSRTLDTNTQAGRDNKASLDTLAGTWNALTPAQQNAEGAADRARSSFIKVARQLGATKSEAEALAAQLLDIPPVVATDIVARGLAQTKDDIDAIKASLDRLPKSKDIHVRTFNETYGKPSGGNRESGVPGAPGAFTGLRVPDHYVDGGRVPGTPPSNPLIDNVPAITAKGNPLMLRSREWIINEPQSDKNDRWLRAINNGLNLDDVFGPLAIPGFASGGRYDDFSALTQSSKLDLARQEQRIIEIQRSLKEKETVKRDGKKVTRDALRGKAREVAQLELQDAKAELAKMKRENAQLKNYGTQEQEEGLRDKAELDEKNAQDAIDAAEKVVREAADRFTSAKSDASSLFTIGSSTSAAQVDRNLTRLLRDSSTFLGLLGDLKSKNASPWLLGELVKAGPTPGAIRLAREYNTNQGALDSINSRASQIDQYTNAYAGLVGNSQFMAPGAWNSGVSSTSQATIQIVTSDPSQWPAEIARMVRHEVASLGAGG